MAGVTNVLVRVEIDGEVVANGLVTPEAAEAVQSVARALVSSPSEESLWSPRIEQRWREGWGSHQRGKFGSEVSPGLY